MEKFWSFIRGLVDLLDTFALVILIAALTFSIGYQIGFTSGLDTKVTLVGEKYTMKVTGNGRR